MNTDFIPAPLDAQTALEDAITKTANFNGTTMDNGVGFAPGGFGEPTAAVVQVTSALGTGTWTGVLQESSNGSDFADIGAAVALPAAGVVVLGGFLSARYSRMKLALAGAGTINLSAWQAPLSRP